MNERLILRDYQESDWPRLMEIHDDARMDELRLKCWRETNQLYSSIRAAAFSRRKWSREKCRATRVFA